MVLAGEKPGNTADADLAAWAEAIRILSKLPVSVVIPGHGERLDPGLLLHTINALKRTKGERQRP
jgi:metallo-beta-lactamase class B